MVQDDSDETLIKHRNVGDQFVLSSRQSDTFRRLADLDLIAQPRSDLDVQRLPVGDLVVVGDDRMPGLGTVLRKLEPDSLAHMYVVECQLRRRPSDDVDFRLQLGRYVALRSLVLSGVGLRRIPDCVFDMALLEVRVV